MPAHRQVGRAVPPLQRHGAEVGEAGPPELRQQQSARGVGRSIASIRCGPATGERSSRRRRRCPGRSHGRPCRPGAWPARPPSAPRSGTRPGNASRGGVDQFGQPQMNGAAVGELGRRPRRRGRPGTRPRAARAVSWPPPPRSRCCRGACAGSGMAATISSARSAASASARRAVPSSPVTARTVRARAVAGPHWSRRHLGRRRSTRSQAARWLPSASSKLMVVGVQHQLPPDGEFGSRVPPGDLGRPHQRRRPRSATISSTRCSCQGLGAPGPGCRTARSGGSLATPAWLASRYRAIPGQARARLGGHDQPQGAGRRSGSRWPAARPAPRRRSRPSADRDGGRAEPLQTAQRPFPLADELDGQAVGPVGLGRARSRRITAAPRRLVLGAVAERAQCRHGSGGQGLPAVDPHHEVGYRLGHDLDAGHGVCRASLLNVRHHRVRLDRPPRGPPGRRGPRGRYQRTRAVSIVEPGPMVISTPYSPG